MVGGKANGGVVAPANGTRRCLPEKVIIHVSGIEEIQYSVGREMEQILAVLTAFLGQWMEMVLGKILVAAISSRPC